MGYDAEKDKLVREVEKAYTKDGVTLPSEDGADMVLGVSIFKYDKGPEKVALYRSYHTAKDGWKPAKLGRLTIDEAKWLASVLDKV